MSLSALQQDFQAWLVTGTDAAAARFAPDAQPGLLVYQNNYRAALMACLEESFARTLAYIGTEGFRSVAARHIDEAPPHSWSLDHYAAHFPAAVARDFPDDPDVGELAALELALTEAFVGPDCEVVEPAGLSHVDWERAMVRWVPTARVLPCVTNAPAIWSALASAESPPLAIMAPRPSPVLVWRQQETSCFRSLETLEAGFAQTLIDGIGFADLCNRLVEACGEGEGIQVAGTWLGRWAADGLLVAIPAEA